MKPCKPSPPVTERIRRWMLFRSAVLAVVAMGLPLWASAGGDANGERALGALTDALSAEALAAAHAKGVEPQIPRAGKNPGVILWDESGSVRRTSITQSTGSGNDQVISASFAGNAGVAWPVGQPLGPGSTAGTAVGIAGRATGDLTDAVSGAITGQLPR